MDEFGKGTTSNDGIGLFCAVIESLLGRGPNCPKVIAATHFHGKFQNLTLELFSLKLNIPKPLICESKMEFLQTAESHCYLYRVVPGRSESSWGLVVAKASGIPDCIIQIAELFSNQNRSDQA